MSTEEVRKAALADLAEREEDERCMAIHAVAVLDALRFHDGDVSANRGKLEGASCGEVRRLVQNMKEVRPEVRQHMLTQFGKGREA